MPVVQEPVETKPAEAVEPEFKTPEEIAAEGTDAVPTSAGQQVLPEPVKAKRRWLPHSRKQWLITGLVTAVLLCGAGGASWALTHKQTRLPSAPKKLAVVSKISAPPQIYSDLSGLPITNASLNSKPVTAVMVENSIDARPQSGLSQAGVVFEAQAEGGITRFMALYQDTTPTNVGPIRSARPYYIQWALGFDAAYAHVGGSPDALSDLTSWNVQNMDEFYNGSYFHRITTRIAPHNVYTGIDTLNQLESAKGYTSTFTGFPRASTQKPMAQPTASTINLDVSGPDYNPQYAYDASTNTYKRSTDGTPDVDANTNQQIAPTVVISIVVPLSQGALDASGAYYSDYNVLGSGEAYVFQNGGVTEGQWHKATNTSQITFTDSTGKSILLDRGQTWITAVSAANQISYTSASGQSTTAN